MAATGVFLFDAYSYKNAAFYELFSYLSAFNGHGKPSSLFASFVTVRIESLSFLIVILLGDRYLCGYSLS